jgi:hypothetical protein
MAQIAYKQILFFQACWTKGFQEWCIKWCDLFKCYCCSNYGWQMKWNRIWSVYVLLVTFLLSSCPAMTQGNTCRHTGWWEGFMKYGVQMGSGSMILVPNFIEWLWHWKISRRRGFKERLAAWWSHRPFIFYKYGKCAKNYYTQDCN